MTDIPMEINPTISISAKTMTKTIIAAIVPNTRRQPPPPSNKTEIHIIKRHSKIILNLHLQKSLPLAFKLLSDGSGDFVGEFVHHNAITEPAAENRRFRDNLDRRDALFPQWTEMWFVSLFNFVDGSPDCLLQIYCLYVHKNQMYLNSSANLHENHHCR